MRNYLESPNWVDHLLDDFKDFMSCEIRFDDVCKKIESMEAQIKTLQKKNISDSRRYFQAGISKYADMKKD